MEAMRGGQRESLSAYNLIMLVTACSRQGLLRLIFQMRWL